MDLNVYYIRSESIVARRIADEYVLVPIRNNTAELETIYTLNEVGTEIWEMLDGKNSLKVICDRLAERFEVSKEEAREDLGDFIKDLSELNCVSLK